MTALLLLSAVTIAYYQEQWENFPLVVSIESENGRETIQSWKKIPDTFYIFLPGYANPEQANLQTNWLHPIAIKGEIVAEYYFDDDSLVTAAVVDSRREGDKYYLTVNSQSGGYNLVVIDLTERKTWVQEADCSSSAECTQMKTITKAGDSIICVPHALVVQGVGDGEIKDPISG